MPDYGLRFVDENPALEGWKKASDIAHTEAGTAGQNLTNQYNLRSMDSRVQQSGATADLTTAQAQKNQAEVPYAGPQAAAHLDQTRAGTENARALHVPEMIKLLNAGDLDGLDLYAKRLGLTVPPEVRQRGAETAGTAAITKQAQDYFKDQPAAAQDYRSKKLAEAKQRLDAGEDPTAVWQSYSRGTQLYSMPEGAPALPTSTDKPMIVPPGATAIHPNTGQPIFRGDAKFQHIGSDTYGNPIFGYPPPAMGAPGGAPQSGPAPAPSAPAPVTPIPGAAPGPRTALPSDARTASAVNPGTSSDAPQPGVAGAAAIRNEPLHGEEFLRTKSSTDAALIRGIAENRINPNSLSIKGGHRERILADVAQYKADYKQQEFMGEGAYQRSAGTMAARVEAASNEVVQLLPQAIETSRNLPRWNVVPLNTLIQKWQQGTSDPAYNEFALANFSLINAYARAMNPQGMPRVQERVEAHALGVLSMATSQQAYEVQAKRLWMEVQASKKATAETRKGVTEGDINAPVPWEPAPGGAQGGAGAPQRPRARNAQGHEIEWNGSAWGPAQ